MTPESKESFTMQDSEYIIPGQRTPEQEESIFAAITHHKELQQEPLAELYEVDELLPRIAQYSEAVVTLRRSNIVGE